MRNPISDLLRTVGVTVRRRREVCVTNLNLRNVGPFFGASLVVLGSIVACGGPDSGDAFDVDQSELAAACGNGVRDPGEQCDDGNTTNLDGCDSTCRFEQNQRVNSLAMQFDTDSVCPANALGRSISSQAHDQLQQAVTDSVKSGDISILFKFMNLQDLYGTNASGLTVGSFLGKPVSGAGYDGTDDLDWWYAADTTSLDGQRNPKTSVPANIAQKKLTAGPGALTLTLALASAPAPYRLDNVRIQGTVAGASKPKASTNGATPGHVAGEHLDSDLSSFTGISNAQLCGNVVASSLAAVPVPQELTSGSYACSQGYSTSNTMLDLFVGGCRVFFVSVISATQPDQFVGAAPPGNKYVFTMSGTKVTGCKNGQGATLPLATCLSSASYSTSFKFTSDRVIIK
jgi:cysteine-rich repeat protein